MEINIVRFEHEIVNQILISELCFDICKSIKIIPGKGSDFLPYYYNLNYIKGLISLHSLLLSKEKGELSIINYISEYKHNFPKTNIQNFKRDISLIANLFKKTFPLPLRNKIAAHIDVSFKHLDFTSAYIIPELVNKYVKIIKQLKVSFFKFCNHAEQDNPFKKIKQQSDSLLKKL